MNARTALSAFKTFNRQQRTFRAMRPSSAYDGDLEMKINLHALYYAYTLYTEEEHTARNVRCWRLKVLNATESAVLAFMK